MEAAGYLVSAAAEFAAGMENGEDYLQSGPSRLRLDVHRNAAAIIRYSNRISRIDGNRNIFAISRQSFINGVVYDLIDQVVESRL